MVPSLPIPNRVMKRSSADDSIRVTVCENRSWPGLCSYFFIKVLALASPPTSLKFHLDRLSGSHSGNFGGEATLLIFFVFNANLSSLASTTSFHPKSNLCIMEQQQVVLWMYSKIKNYFKYWFLS